MSAFTAYHFFFSSQYSIIIIRVFVANISFGFVNDISYDAASSPLPILLPLLFDVKEKI